MVVAAAACKLARFLLGLLAGELVMANCLANWQTCGKVILLPTQKAAENTQIDDSERRTKARTKVLLPVFFFIWIWIFNL